MKGKRRSSTQNSKLKMQKSKSSAGTVFFGVGFALAIFLFAGPASVRADFPNVAVINGMVIVNSAKDVNPDGVPVKPGLTVKDNALLESPKFYAQVARWYLKQPMDDETMRGLQREIILYFRAHDRPLVDVLYPEQDVSNGMIQIIVLEGRLDQIKVQDKQGRPYTNGWSGVKFLHNSIRLRTNDVIVESRMVEDLDWLNRNPFRKVEAVYEPDKVEFGKTSVLLRVEEQRQWSADLGYEDSGNRITSDDRITAGVTWGKAFGVMDNQFRYAFTFDPSLEALRAHSASYYAPLPWRHGLRLSGYYVDVKGQVDTHSSLQGSAYQISARYEVPLPALRKYQHEASIGLDFKNSDNSLIFGAFKDNTPTEVFQIAAGYSAALPDPFGKTALSIQGYYSPGNVTDLNNDTQFDKNHTRAEANYAYARFNLERSTTLPAGFTWIFRGMTQVASGNLITSEQFGMGGYATVRGYEEREANKDEGFFISNELRTPPFGLLQMFRKAAGWDEKLQLLGFWDYGQAHNFKPTPFEHSFTEMSSVGAGLRYRLSRHFELRFDYGWQLTDSGESRTGSTQQRRSSSRGHIGVVATY